MSAEGGMTDRRTNNHYPLRRHTFNSTISDTHLLKAGGARGRGTYAAHGQASRDGGHYLPLLAGIAVAVDLAPNRGEEEVHQGFEA